jgi:hypothetical protein
MVFDANRGEKRDGDDGGSLSILGDFDNIFVGVIWLLSKSASFNFGLFLSSGKFFSISSGFGDNKAGQDSRLNIISAVLGSSPNTCD